MYRNETFLVADGISSRELYANYLAGSVNAENSLKNMSKNVSLVNFEDVVIPVADFLESSGRVGRLNSESVFEYW